VRRKPAGVKIISIDVDRGASRTEGGLTDELEGHANEEIPSEREEISDGHSVNADVIGTKESSWSDDCRLPVWRC
jgi:hypothetical protein